MIKCLDAYKNLNLTIRNNKPAISPCCISPTANVENLDFANDSYLQSIRNKFDQEQWPVSCKNCRDNESSGYVSRRQGSNQWYKDHNINDTTVELVRLDFWVGDLCNLACAICGPQYSSVWQSELGIQRSTAVNLIWKQLDLSKIKYVHFNGGEPLLSKEHIQFLEAIPNKSQTYLNYNTNATILPSKYLQQLWLQFKLVQLDFSIDDIGERFEYQRYPAKWSQVVQNLKWYIEFAPHNCVFGVNTTVGILNQHNVNNLFQWLNDNFKQSRFGDPVEFKQQNALGTFSASADLAQVKHQLDVLDRRRGTDWRKTFPELV